MPAGTNASTTALFGTDIFAIFDVQHVDVILGTGTGWPLQVKSVNVWQAP